MTIMDFQKPILIMSEPRSGSHYMGHIISLYVTKKFGMKFGINHMKLDDTVEDLIKENIRRGRKVFHSHFYFYNMKPQNSLNIPNDVKFIDSIFNNNIILLTREDTWKQFLSIYVARMTMKYQVYFRGEKHLDDHNRNFVKNGMHKGMFRIDLENDMTMRFIKKLSKKIKPRGINYWPNSPKFVFEDWISNPLDKIIEHVPELSDVKDYVTPEDLVTMSEKMPYPFLLRSI